MHFPFISKVIRHCSVISPSIFGVLSTFRTLVGFVFCFHHLCDIPLLINNPSAPQSMRAVTFSVLSLVSTVMGIDILQFNIERTVT